MRSAIVSKNRAGDEIEVGVYASDEIRKAYNHNIGDTLPRRQFIPDEDQVFKKPIMNKVNRKIKEFKSGNVTTEKLTLNDLLNRAFSESTVTSSSSGSNIGVSIGGLLDILDVIDGQ